MNTNVTSKVSKVRYDPDKPHEKIVKLDYQPVQNVAEGTCANPGNLNCHVQFATSSMAKLDFFLLLAGAPSVARVNKQDHDSCIISGHHIPKGAEKPSKKLVGVSHEYCPTPINGEKGCKVHSIQTCTHTSCHEKISTLPKRLSNYYRNGRYGNTRWRSVNSRLD